jgi:hypothetical protein
MIEHPLLAMAIADQNAATGKTEVIAAVCAALSDGGGAQAVSMLNLHYPFAPQPVSKRRYGPMESTRVFVRDGFIDRYSGERLIFPPVLRLLSSVLPEAFPYHPNWKTDATHPAYWEVAATVDHLVAVTRGGTDDEANLFTTSMAHNFAKMNWTLEELGWSLRPVGDLKAWDGLIHWFVEYASTHAELSVNSLLKQWLLAARLATQRI